MTTETGMTHRRLIAVMCALMLGMGLASLDQTIVAAAAPTIVGELGGLEQLSWVITAYLLAMTVSAPLYGKLGDLFGRKPLYLFAFTVFALASLLCGITTSMTALIAFRAIQGVGAGGLLVLSISIVADVVSPRQRGKYQGYFGAAIGAASVAGPLLGGFISENASWRWVFLINIPFAAVGILLTLVVMPATPRRRNITIDYPGFALLSAFVICVVLATSWGGRDFGWASPQILGLVVGAGALLAAFIIVERRAVEPVIPLRLFRDRTFSVATSINFLLGFAMFGTVSYLPVYMQVGRSVSPTNSGLLLIPFMTGFLISSVVVGQIVSRTGHYRRFPIVGMLMAAVFAISLATLDIDTSFVLATVLMIGFGVGCGMSMQVLILAAQNSVPFADVGVATSATTFFRSVGGAVGVALLGTVLSLRIADQINPELAAALNRGGEATSIAPETLEALSAVARSELAHAVVGATSTIFLIVAPILLLAFGIACLLPEKPLRTHTRDASVDDAAAEDDDESDEPLVRTDADESIMRPATHP